MDMHPPPSFCKRYEHLASKKRRNKEILVTKQNNEADLKEITTLNHKVLDDPVKLTLLVTKRLPSLSAFFTFR